MTMCHAGTTTVAIGIAATATSAAVATMCFVAAAARGIAMSRTRAIARISVALRTTSSMVSTAPAACSLAASSNRVVMSASFLLGLLDQRGQPVELVVCDVRSLLLEERGHDVGGGAVEERGQELVERGETHFFPVCGGEIDVTRAVVLRSEEHT